jgi:hypothetical protein
MIRRALTAAAMALIAVTRAGGAAHVHQAEPPTVWVAATVTAGDGRVIRGLTPDQFLVEVDDAPASVVECVEGPAFAVSVVVDASGSMYGVTLDEFRAIGRSLPGLLRASDIASLNWFGPGLGIGTFSRAWSGFEPTVKEFEKAQKILFSPSPVWDAINTVITALERQSERRVLIVWTDGRVTGSVVPFDIAARHALNAGVTALFMVPHMPPPNLKLPRPAARNSARGRRGAPQSAGELGLILPWERPRILAEMTGGVAASFSAGSERPKDRIERLIEGLKTDYLIRVKVETADGRLHPIDVKVKAPELTVRAPASVFVPR